ncbi:MAG: metal ABC transporter permease [Gemmataceae bacterium]|nr:metal ABC transporter permease [Gemmataceae bacterium]
MSEWLTYNSLIVLQGVTLLGACSGVIGCFAVLRRRSLVGDALAHSSLPGVCLAFLLVGEKHFWAMLLGAFLAGLIGLGIMAALKRWTRIKEDASIAIILSTFFGAGVVLRSLIQQMPLSGRSGLDSFIFGQTAGMIEEDVHLITALSAGTLAIVALCYKEFKLVAFDPEFAQVQGWPARLLDFALMLLLLGAVVIGLPAVGILLMAAMLIIPAAAARFWTRRLAWMLLISAGIGMASGIVGTYLSATQGVATGPCIILVAAGLFLLSLGFAPKRGVIAQQLARRRDRFRLETPLGAGEEPAP